MGFENGKLVRVVLRATVGSRQEVLTLHYDLIDAIGGTNNDPQTLADLFRDNVIPVYKTFFRSNWTIQPVEVVEEIDPQHPLDPRSSWTSGTTVAGTNASSAQLLPTASCMIVALKTPHIGRRFNGRMFLGGSWNEDDQNSGAWAAGTLTGVATLLAAIPVQPDLATGPSDSVAHWCVYSRTQRAANADPYASPVTSTIRRPNVRWLRRRQDL